MRLIDADALTKEIKTDIEDAGLQERMVLYRIYEAPTIEAVEVVRCMECKHHSIEGETTHFVWCGYWNKPTDEMRYCSDGEREDK